MPGAAHDLGPLQIFFYLFVSLSLSREGAFCASRQLAYSGTVRLGSDGIVCTPVRGTVPCVMFPVFDSSPQQQQKKSDQETPFVVAAPYVRFQTSTGVKIHVNTCKGRG